MEQAQSEEVMRVKNQNAIQRAIQNDQGKDGRFKPSINALKNQYDNRAEYKSAGHENQPPLSARAGHKSSIAQRIEAEAIER